VRVAQAEMAEADVDLIAIHLDLKKLGAIIKQLNRGAFYENVFTSCRSSFFRGALSRGGKSSVRRT
jgi:hypothetical protein